MKIMIEIPEEFICDYEADRFEDCFQRFICDSKTGPMAGNYERETAEMMIKAFRDAKEVIRCKDCKKWERETFFQDGWCRGRRQGDPNWFCVDGRRREDETDI